ncbi:MAG: hypothetical protein K0U66_01190, partial [Gammaproteobacteria bacterium]|nr:hypothetical protein [Gammaproteobacteria bacterium]
MSFFNRPVSNHTHTGITLSVALALSFVLASCGSGNKAATPTTPVTPLAVPNLANAAATTLVVGTAATINFTNGGGGSLLADDATPNAGCTATNLPNGLAVGRTSNNNSCAITGTPDTVTTEAVTVTVTARNATGVDAAPATVAITINAADPVTTLAVPNLAYAGGDVSAVIGTAITTIEFTNSGGGELLANDASPAGCSASPDLPSGLTIQRTTNGSSCEITGTPDEDSAQATYTVTTRNATGPDTSTPEVKIAVRAVATADIPNPDSRLLGTVGIPFSETFTNDGGSVAATGGCTLKEEATLPLGLTLAAVDVNGTMTCRISGNPTEAKAAIYTLVATSIDDNTDEATFYLEIDEQEEVPAACQMFEGYISADGTGYPVTAGGYTGRLYLNGGTVTEGGDNPSFLLRYKGQVNSKDVYQAAVEFGAATASTSLKITSDDGTDSTGPSTQFYVQTATAAAATDIETAALATDGTALPVARGDADGVSTSNTADLSAENPFLFTLTLDTTNPANGLAAGTLAIAACTDTTNPTATAAATPASSQSATAGAISFTASEAGTAYVLLLPPPGAGESAPDANAVVANAASVEENVEAGTASVSINTRTRADSTPLTAATTYAAYIVIRDEAGNLSEVTKVDITTTPAQTTDTTAPTISAVTVDGIVALGATLNLTSNEPGDVFVVTLPAATPAPTTADAIINPAVNSDSNEDNDIPHTRADITADTTTAVAITGLDPATDYTAHYTVVDVAGNATAVASTTPTFTTLELAPYLAPAIDQLNLVANSAEDGAVNIIFANLTGTTLLAQDATTPGCQATGLPAGLTITQIDQDEDDGGTTCQITGTVTLATTDGPVIATITATSAGGSSTTVVLFAVAAATTTTNPVLTVTGGTDARTFPIDALITPIVISFTNGGDNPACTVEPALPQGLNATLAADKMSCTIAGTPSAATASKVYTITVANGAQTGMATVTIGTTDPTDTTDPTLSPITATAPTGSSVTVNLTSTENGTGYVLVSATSATLTAQDVITRVNADAASDFVATPTLTADMAATANITGLQATTQYFVYAVATDASANPSTVGTTSFTTTVATDTTAPLLSATTVTATSDTTATVSLTSNEAGTGYILITARDAANTLDNAAIIARVIAAASSDVVATTAITIPGTATTTNITGLTASTTYTA